MEFSRRDWVLGALGSTALSAIAAARDYGDKAVRQTTGSQFEFFDTFSAAEVAAIASQILPSEDGPGAAEAGVIFFIDRALKTFDSDKQEIYRKGLADLQEIRRKMFPGNISIAALSREQQREFVRAIEKSDFFEIIRVHTLLGFLGPPSYGGNRDRPIFNLSLLIVLLIIPAAMPRCAGNQNTPGDAYQSQVSILDLTLGKNTLADVRAKLGAARVEERGHTSAWTRQICYISATGDGTKLTFKSSVIGGGVYLTGFAISQAGDVVNVNRSCKPSFSVSRGLRTEGGIGLGLSKSQVIALLGQPKETNGSLVTFESAFEKRSGTRAEIYDVLTVIQIVIRNSQTVSVRVSHTETS